HRCVGRRPRDQHANGRNSSRNAYCCDGTQPIAHTVSQETHHSHSAGEKGEGKAGDRQRRTHLLLEIQSRPVKDRTFRHHAEKSHKPYEISARLPGESAAWRRFGG